MYSRVKITAPLSILGFLISIAACADDPGNGGPQPVQDAGPVVPWWDSAAPPAPSGGGDDTSDGAPIHEDAGANDGGSVTPEGGADAGANEAGDAATTDASSDAGACPAGGAPEIEPNETPAKATAFTKIACGAIAPAADVDVWTFTLPANATTLGLHYDGGITLTVSAGGDTVTIPGAPSMPFHAGAVYTITVRASNGQPGPYDILLQY